MHPVIVKTFGGLSKSYYFRQLFFSLLFLAFIIFMATRSQHGLSFLVMLVTVVNTLLYPYARFIYENIVNFIIGRNIFFINAFFMMLMKLMTMTLCWAGAIFIAPIGLAYLYYHHSKN
ncbi:hypothetical protein [Aeromonas sp.]|uniref:hypothetical protein n=1 Tax=Aeromonas sp. TaxID=647 RepID=UPI0025851F14|nr:hypothetical protein [Aeromonas sp.]MCX7132093.1 hypothetical protein [Aeromonas sp.]